MLTWIQPNYTSITEIRKQNKEVTWNQTNEFQEILEKTTEEDKIKKACEEMEVYMLSKIFKQMKASTKWGEGLIPTGQYETMFEDLHIEEQAKRMVVAGGIGLADMMYENMIATYESFSPIEETE